MEAVFTSSALLPRAVVPPGASTAVRGLRSSTPPPVRPLPLCSAPGRRGAESPALPLRNGRRRTPNTRPPPPPASSPPLRAGPPRRRVVGPPPPRRATADPESPTASAPPPPRRPPPPPASVLHRAGLSPTASLPLSCSISFLHSSTSGSVCRLPQQSSPLAGAQRPQESGVRWLEEGVLVPTVDSPLPTALIPASRCSAPLPPMETGGGPTLKPLLCLAWLAATLPIVAAALPIPAAAGGRLVHSLLAAFSARGKTVRPSSSSSTSKAKFTVPQKYFLHFYVVGAVVTSCLLLAIWFYAYMKMTPLLPEPSIYSTVASHLVGSNSFSSGSVRSRTMEHKYRVWRTVFVLVLMEIQVLRRLYETENVFHYSPSARMHIIGYLTGLFYYVAAPLSLASSCIPEATDYLQGQIAEFIVKGRARMPDLVIDSSSLLMPLLKLGWCQWIGAVIFIWGSLHQIRCHAILGSLRERKDSDEYAIPCGDWFNRVSCPHYLAELVIYLGMLIASGGSDISVWFLFIFVITNLSFAAVQTHKWYLQKFEDYPRSRYAIIPFVC